MLFGPTVDVPLDIGHRGYGFNVWKHMQAAPAAPTALKVRSLGLNEPPPMTVDMDFATISELHAAAGTCERCWLGSARSSALVLWLFAVTPLHTYFMLKSGRVHMPAMYYTCIGSTNPVDCGGTTLNFAAWTQIGWRVL
jgi:hypothetical protein